MVDIPAKSTRGLVIVPAYNEAESIERVVCAIRQSVPEFDVLVVDDGSTDATLARIPEGVETLSLPFNLGIGGAMQTGYRYAAAHGYDLAIQADADGQHPAHEIHKLVEPLRNGEADLVIGSRFLRRGSYRQSATRAMGARILSLLLRVLTGRRFTDCTSGFRAANRRVIKAYAYWYPDDYPEPEVVLLLHRAGFRVTETAVEMNPRTGGKTSISLWRGLFYVTKVSLALFLDMLRNPWPKDKVDQ